MRRRSCKIKDTHGSTDKLAVFEWSNLLHLHHMKNKTEE